MTNISFDLSNKVDKWILDPLYLIKKSADSFSIPFFLVGATARDLLMKHCFGIESPRRTFDIDLGIKVSTWNDFDKLTGALVTTGRFKPTSEKQRFLFANDSTPVKVDIVPFGDIEGPCRIIYWPPEHEIFMSLLGFHEAYENSINVRLSSEPELDIKLPPLSGLAIMKLISWKEKYPDRKKDAEDLYFIMINFIHSVNEGRLYVHEADLLKDESFDNEKACIRILGREMATIANPETMREIENIFALNQIERLITDMIPLGRYIFDRNFEEIKIKVEKLRQGFIENMCDKSKTLALR